MKVLPHRILEFTGIVGILLGMISCNFFSIGGNAPQASQPTTNPEPTATTDPTANCPAASATTKAYINLDAGYCLLYPSDFNLNPGSVRPEVIDFTGPVLPPPPNAMESIAPNLTLEFNGPADGLDSAGYANKWQLLFIPEGHLPQRQATIGGQPAIVLNNIPGMLSSQGGFVVTNGYKYLLTVFPELGFVTAIDADIQRGWDTIVNSIVFFPPQSGLSVVRPQDVCPQETSYGHVYINEVDGYCHLYPVDFFYNPQYEGRFDGGPVLAYNATFGGDIRTNINVGTFGYFPGQTPRQVIANWMEFIDTTSLVDMTIGNSPAVAFIDPRGPWPHRTAFINADGNVYTILVQPYDPVTFPQGILYANKAWDLVTTSLRFFDAWH